MASVSAPGSSVSRSARPARRRGRRPLRSSGWRRARWPDDVRVSQEEARGACRGMAEQAVASTGEGRGCRLRGDRAGRVSHSWGPMRRFPEGIPPHQDRDLRDTNRRSQDEGAAMTRTRKTPRTPLGDRLRTFAAGYEKVGQVERAEGLVQAADTVDDFFESQNLATDDPMGALREAATLITEAAADLAS